MFGLASKLFSGHNKQFGKTTFKPQFEVLENREVMSVMSPLRSAIVNAGVFQMSQPLPQPTPAGLALINGLADTPVRSTALADYQRDASITRNDMIDILYHGTDGFGFVTAGELASLKTLVSHGSTVDMPAYVQNLASKVIGGNPLGSAGAETMSQRVDNFFLGQVRPDATYIPYAGAGPVTATYQQVNEPLWNRSSGPSYRDVAQGYGAADDWLLSSLKEVAYRNAGDITSMFIDNGDSTYTVRFYNGSTPDYVTVDNNLPSGPGNVLGTDGVPLQVSIGAQRTSVLWVALAEKAYAQENAAGWIGTNHKGADSYQALNGGNPAWALSAVTGLSASSSTTINASALATAWSQGKFLVLSTTTPQSDLVHRFSSYALVDYSSGWFTLSPCDGYSPEIAVSSSVMAANFQSVAQTGAASSAARHTVTGFVPAGLQAGAVLKNQTSTVSYNQTQTNPQNTFIAPSGPQVDAAKLAALKTVKNRGVLSLAPFSDAAVADVFGTFGT